MEVSDEREILPLRSHAVVVMSTSARRQLNKTPERELGLHDDRAAAVETPNANGVVARQMQDGRCVAVLVDAVTGRDLAMSSGRYDLLSVHALYPFVVADKHAERPSPGHVVIDKLANTRDTISQELHVSAKLHLRHERTETNGQTPGIEFGAF